MGQSNLRFKQGHDFISKQVYFLMLIYPLIYLFAKVIGVTRLYAIKDAIILLIFIQLIIIFLKEGLRIKTDFIVLIIYFFYVLLSSVYNLSDILFWLLGIREMIVNPLIFIFMGYYISNKIGENISFFYFWSLFIAIFLTVAYTLYNYSAAFSTTGRLISFWDGEHEPAIIGGLMILWLLSAKQWTYSHKALLFLSAALILLSGSRSVLIALLISTLYLIFLSVKGIKKYMLLIVTVGFTAVIYIYYDFIFTRPIDYNLSLRTSQWTLASSSIKQSPLIGIGIDKYGVVGSLRKIYSKDGYSTVTMDSSLIKYTVNLGLTYLLLFTLIIRQAINKINKINKINIEINNLILFLKIMLIYSIVIGLVTGKLGAFPLNMYFYIGLGSCFGLYSYYRNLVSK